MKTLLKSLFISAILTTALAAAEFPVNGTFEKNQKGDPINWQIRNMRPTVNVEVLPASDQKGNALLIETDKSVLPVSCQIMHLKNCKKVNVSLRAKGNAGFAVQLNGFNKNCRYVTTSLVLESRVSGDEFKEFKGSVQIPENTGDKKIEYFSINLLVFSRSQIVFENVQLSGE